MKKIIAALSAVILLFTSFFLIGTSASGEFTDIRTSDWFYDDVKFVRENELMNGTSSTEFSPNGLTTRGMIVTILWRLEGEPDASENGFDDVKKEAYYRKAVSWASENKIVTGYNEKSFGPDDFATREQLSAIMYRYAGYKDLDLVGAELPESFSDKASVSAYAVESLEWAYCNGLISGTSDTTLSPKEFTKRCQVAAILRRFCTNALNEASQETPSNRESGQAAEDARQENTSGDSATASKPSGSTSQGSGSGDSAGVVPTVFIKDVYAAPGEEISVPVEIKGNPGVLGMALTVYYDETVCTLRGAENGEALRGVLELTPSKTLGNGARFVWDGIEISDEDIKNGEILVLNFKVKESAKSGACPITLKFFDGDVLNNDLEEIYLRADSGNIIIVSK